MSEGAAMVRDDAGAAAKAGPVDVDMTVETGGWPEPGALQRLAVRAVGAAAAAAGRSLAASEVSIVFTDDAAMRRLNGRWRGCDRPTNVLSFPQAGGPLLGDIVLGWETVSGEAALAGRPLEHHIAHLVVHGCLHLFGYNHEDEAEAERMEDLERAALSAIGVPDPYAPPPTEQ